MRHFQNKEINAIKISLFLGGTRYLILVHTLADRLTHQQYYVYDIAAQRRAAPYLQSLAHSELEGQVESA